MAVTGIPAPPTNPAAEVTPLPTQHLLVQRRGFWIPNGFWYPADYLEPIEAEDVAAPSISRATFRFHFGRIKREDQTSVSVVDPQDLIDTWVRVQLINGYDPVLGLVPNTTLWVGRFTEQSLKEMRTLSTGARQGTVEMTAFGMADMLDREPYWRSYVRDAAGVAKWVDRRLVFNDFRPEGIRLGNCSVATYPDPWAVGRDIHVFDTPDGNAFPWTAADIVEHLLYTHQQGLYPAGSPPAQTVNWEVAGQWDALGQITPVRVDPSGRSVWSTITGVIDRRRGFGAAVRVDDATDAVSLHIFSMLDTPIVVGAATTPANAEPVTIDLDTISPQGEASVSTDATQLQAKEIIVQGQHIKSICTVSVADGSLIEGWTSDEETAYKAAIGGTAEENDLARRGEAYSRVYCEFIIPDDWTFATSNPPGVAMLTSAQRLAIGNNANPRFLEDGQVAYTVADPPPAVITPGSAIPDQVGDARGWGLSLLKSMPIRILPGSPYVDYDDQGFTEPFVIAKLSNDAYQFVEKLEDSPMQLKILQDRCGFRLELPDRHALALNHWSGAAASLVEPTYDYDDLFATLCIEMDTRLNVREIIGSQIVGLSRRGRVMVIDVPDAEFVWVPNRTVLDVTGESTAGGGATHYTVPNTLTAHPYILRDDSQRLREIARAARNWYVNPRRAVTISLPRLVPDYKVGMLLETVSQAATFIGVKSVITKVSWDFERMTTSITTGFAELDFTLR